LLDEGVHPYKFPQPILSGFLFFKNIFSSGGVEEPIKLPGISRVTFDLCIQFSICKEITLDSSQSADRSIEIDTILDLVFAGFALGVPRLDTEMEKYIRKTLGNQRNALKGRHIRRVFTLQKGHALRKLFVQASLFPFMMFQEDFRGQRSNPYDDVEDDEEVGAARRAVGGPRFMFQVEMDSSPDFKMELLEEMAKAVHNRAVVKPRGHKKFEVRFRDPLSGEVFTFTK